MSDQTKHTSDPATLEGAWWLHPVVVFSMPVVIAGITAYYTDGASYLRHWRTQKYFDASALGLLSVVVLTFACGCLFGGARRRKSGQHYPADWKRDIRWTLVKTLFNLSFTLTIVAYTIWFGMAIKDGLRPSVIYSLLSSSGSTTNSPLDEHLKTIPGVTTATQFGLAVIVLGVPLGTVAGWRRVRWQIMAVFALALVRSFLNSERLAIIELLIPFHRGLYLIPKASQRADVQDYSSHTYFRTSAAVFLFRRHGVFPVLDSLLLAHRKQFLELHRFTADGLLHDGAQ